MLTRFRIEVEGGDSAAATEAELTKYEHALQWMEATRYGCHRDSDEAAEVLQGWHDADVIERSFFNSELGREVTDEVIEYDASLPGYKGRRVVQFKRLDTRWTASVQEEGTTSTGTVSSFRVTPAGGVSSD